jgi:hypothetical protein
MPSRRDDPDLMGAEAIRSVDDQNGAMTSSDIEKFRRPPKPPIFIRSISTASQDENLNG